MSPISVPSPGERDLRNRLREDTRTLHQTLESRLPLGAETPSLSAYEDHLRFLLGYFGPVEEALRDVQGLRSLVPDLGWRWKTPLLEEDLSADRADRSAPDSIVHRPANPAQALGVLYVLEGSTLGGRVLLKRLRSLPDFPGHLGIRFLSVYGDEAGAMWSRFLETLGHVEEKDWDETVGSARATFQALGDWYDVWENSRPGVTS